MSKNQFYTVVLQSNDIELTINALDIANYCFKNLASQLLVEATDQQINNIISHHNLIKKSLKKSLEDTSTLCPCPPETSPLDEVGGGIPARHMLLSESVSGGLSVTGDFLASDLDFLFKPRLSANCLYCDIEISFDDALENDGVCNDCYIYDCPHCHGQLSRDELNSDSCCGYCFPDDEGEQ